MNLRALFIPFLLGLTGARAQQTLVYTYPLRQIVATAPAPDGCLTVLIAPNVVHTASPELIQVNVERGEFRVGVRSGGDGWINLPGSVGGGSKRETVASPTVYQNEWRSGNPAPMTVRVTTDCASYADLAACARQHQRAVAAMAAIFPPA